MELLLFRHDEFDKLYGCEGFNADKIPLEQRTNILSMFMNALETGILGIIGAVYCDYPLLIYTTGSMGLCNKLLCLLALPICYAIAMTMFTKPLLFSGIYLSWIFNPYVGYTDDFGKIYDNTLDDVHNFTVICGLSAVYLLFSAILSCPPVVYLLLSKRIRNDCANFCRAIYRFLCKGNNSVTNGPIAMAWMTPNYAVNNANNRNNNHLQWH
ncbi:hypothetical protein niasHT_038374 [Heterodera trifolii]|uniref:Uncharacterized protein n=1 Tax=Heterodera trifolii TaxID=157864 RepID=A0ABD2IPR6_9BILA